MKTAVATNKQEDMSGRLLEHFGIAEYMDVICGSDPMAKRTKPDIICKAMHRVQMTDIQEALMVGDSDNDAKGAETVGVSFVAAAYGFGFHSTEDVADFPHIGIIQRPLDLLEYVS